jgi:glutathione S-transferase
MAQLLEGGRRALGVVEARLSAADWMAGGAFSIADIALYAYTHMAGDGGYDLAEFPATCRWLGRVAALPRHVSLSHVPVSHVPVSHVPVSDGPISAGT